MNAFIEKNNGQFQGTRYKKLHIFSRTYNNNVIPIMLNSWRRGLLLYVGIL